MTAAVKEFAEGFDSSAKNTQQAKK